MIVNKLLLEGYETDMFIFLRVRNHDKGTVRTYSWYIINVQY